MRRLCYCGVIVALAWCWTPPPEAAQGQAKPAKKGQTCRLNIGQGFVRDGVATSLEVFKTGLGLRELNAQAQGGQHFGRGGDDFLANPIAGDKADLHLTIPRPPPVFLRWP